MSEDMNINQGQTGFQTDFTEFDPATQGSQQTQGASGIANQPITDAPRDSVQAAGSEAAPRALLAALPSQTSNPVIAQPDAELAAAGHGNHYTQAPQPGQQGYSSFVNAFASPGGSPDEAAAAFSAFVAEFPPGSPEYQAMLNVINFPINDPNLPDSMELFSAAREQIIESGALEENVAGPAGLRNRDSVARDNRIPVNQLTQSDLESMTPEQLAAYSDEEIQQIIADFPEHASHVTELAADSIMLGNVDAETINYEKAFNLSGTIEEWVENATNLIKGLPDSAEKDTMLGFLSKISAALVEFTELLYQLQTTDSEKTREFTAAKLDETLGKIEKQRKAMRKQIRAAKKGKEKKKMGVMGKILQGVAVAMILTVCVLLIACTPGSLGLTMLVLPLLLATAADMMMQMSGEKKGVFEHLFDGVAAVTEKACKKMGMSDKLTSVAVTSVKAVTAAVIITVMVGTGAFLVGGADTIKMALFDSGLIKNKIAQMVIGVTIDAVVMIVQVAIAIALLATGVGAPAGAALIVGTTAQTMATIARVGNAALQMIMIVATITMAIMSIADSANKIELGRIKMILSKQLANLEEDVALREMLIELLKKAIKAMQDSLSSLSSTLSQVQGDRGAMWQKLTNEMQKLHAALGA